MLDQIVKLNGMSRYEGSVQECDTYEAHGTTLELKGHMEYTDYLHRIIENIEPKDVANFVKASEALATFLPPLYVGVALKQSIQDRYAQHYSNYNLVKQGTFGGRLAEAGFEWGDIVFSCSSPSSLRMEDSTLKVLETYIHFFTRPKLGRI